MSVLFGGGGVISLRLSSDVVAHSVIFGGE